MTNSICREAVSRRLQLWEERYARHVHGWRCVCGTCHGAPPLPEARWSPQSWRNGLPHNLPKRRPSLRKDAKDVKNENWWQQHLIREAGTIGSPSSEATWRPSYIMYTAPSSRPAAPSPDLLPLPTGIGLLPGFEHVKEKVWLRSAVVAINELRG